MSDDTSKRPTPGRSPACNGNRLRGEDITERWRETFAPLDVVCYASQGRLDVMITAALNEAEERGRRQGLEEAANIHANYNGAPQNFGVIIWYRDSIRELLEKSPLGSVVEERKTE